MRIKHHQSLQNSLCHTTFKREKSARIRDSAWSDAFDMVSVNSCGGRFIGCRAGFEQQQCVSNHLVVMALHATAKVRQRRRQRHISVPFSASRTVIDVCTKSQQLSVNPDVHANPTRPLSSCRAHKVTPTWIFEHVNRHNGDFWLDRLTGYGRRHPNDGCESVADSVVVVVDFWNVALVGGCSGLYRRRHRCRTNSGCHF